MGIEEIREYCIKKQAVTESFPFDEETLVFKVCGKIFLFVVLGSNSIHLKCDPELVVSLREHYDAVLPGYHMNKKFWNTVLLSGGIPYKLIYEWIDHSYEQVVAKLPKHEREKLSAVK